MKVNLLFTVMAALLLSACASGPRIESNINPGTDFRSFQSYNFITPLGTDRSNGVRTPLSASLMAAMDGEMRQRGLSKSDSPVLLVDFAVSSTDRVQVRTTPNHSVQRSHWNRGFSTWPSYSTSVRQYTEGSLIVDLIDPASNSLVAEGAATSRISSTELTQQQAKDVVAQVMAGIWAQ
ncbi:MAG: DUF4136 domain-containing protein [Xanthomonadales bacterium]|nr:DUF4136 domain-containing protein [Xanthomonadales bacterium]